jgi:hypothetical protein
MEIMRRRKPRAKSGSYETSFIMATTKKAARKRELIEPPTGGPRQEVTC